jgi:hypothetical protein
MASISAIGYVEATVETSPSRLRAPVRETRNALDLLRRHEELLAGSWCTLLDAVERRVNRFDAGNADDLSLRTTRAALATAAGEAAQTARFDARLLQLRPRELAEVGAALESRIELVRESQAEAAAHLSATVDGILARFEKRVRRDPGASAPGAMQRRVDRFGEDLMTAMRVYADRIEQLLFELSDAVRDAFGLAMGAALPTRVPRARPGLDPRQVEVVDPACPPAGLHDAAWRLVELSQEAVDQRADDAIRALRSRLGRAAEHARRDERSIRARIDELVLQARQLDELAETLGWMLPTDCDRAGRPSLGAVRLGKTAFRG